MKILFTYEYPFHKSGYGGGQQIVRDFSKALTNLGHEVIIACLGTDELQLNIIDKPVRFEFQYNYKVGVRSFLFTSFGSIKLINKYKPDFVLSFSSESAIISLYCKLVNIPFAIYIAAPYLPIFKINKFKIYFKNIRYHLPLYLQYIGCLFSKKIFTISDFILIQALENWQISNKKIQTLGCAISEIVINYEPNKTHLNKNIKIATTGRIMYSQKPINILAQCLSQLDNISFEWHVIGTGKDLDDFRIELNKLGIEKFTKLHSTLSTPQICNLYDSIDVVILPSFNESFFLTAYEAISLKKIVITNKVALLDEIFKDFKTIIFLEDVSINSIECALRLSIDLINDKNISNDLSAASKFVNSNFNWNKISLKLLENVEK
jgi:glycosyltransferase involved in cell wall biosynthesis